MLIETPFAWAVLACAFALVLACGLEDACRYRIPNILVAGLLALYPIHVLVSTTPVDWLWSLGLFALILVLGIAAFSTGKMGGGDVKLLAVCALWAGPTHILPFLFVCALVGGGIALILTINLRYSLSCACETLHMPRIAELFLGRVVPYGIAIAAGMTLVFGRLALGV